jgi:hypothetical protein
MNLFSENNKKTEIENGSKNFSPKISYIGILK